MYLNDMYAFKIGGFVNHTVFLVKHLLLGRVNVLLTLFSFDNFYTFIITPWTGYTPMDKPTNTIFAATWLIIYT